MAPNAKIWFTDASKTNEGTGLGVFGQELNNQIYTQLKDAPTLTWTNDKLDRTSPFRQPGSNKNINLQHD